MATISSTLKMFDSMSRPLQNITQGMNMMISTMHQMQNAAERNTNIDRTLTAAKERIAAAEIDIRNSIDQATRAQDRFNEAAQSGTKHTNGLLSNIKSMAAAYLSFQTARAIGESTIVAAMNRQQTLDTFSARAGSETLGAAIYDRIAKQALSLGQDVEASLAGTMSFMSNTMDPGNLAQLNRLAMRLAKLNPTEGLGGAAFSLKELMSGDYTSIAERFNMSRTMLQNSAARKAGLEGDVEKFIAGMDNLLNQQKMTEEAFEKMLDSPAAKWQSAINTFKFNMANAGQSSVIALTPLFDMMNQMFEDGRMQTFFNGLNTALVGLAKGALWLANVGLGIQRNWEMIAPAIWSIIGALIIYNGNSLISMANTTKDIILKIAHAAASSAETIAIIGLTIAQEGLNAAIALCPITWIIGAIIILIATFYFAVAAVNHFAGTSLSATGLIAGAFMWLVALIGNLLVASFNFMLSTVDSVLNTVALFAEFLANVFIDPVGSIVRLFSGMADTILSLLQNIASAIDTIFGSNLADAVGGWRSGLKGAVDDLVGEAAIQLPRLDSSAMQLERYDLTNAFDAGYKWGDDLAKKFNLGNMFKAPEDLGALANGWDGTIPDIDKVGEVGKIKDKVDISSEDIKIMRELAEMKNIQNFVTLTPTVSVSTGDIRNGEDTNTIIAKIKTMLEQDIASSASAVYG